MERVQLNHLANAAINLNWKVDVYDLDPSALDRMKNDIYPSRYGKWDERISLFENKQMKDIKYDYIFIGTPPDHHVELLLKSIEKILRLY